MTCFSNLTPLSTQGNEMEFSISSICGFSSFCFDLIWMISSHVFTIIPLSIPNETCTYTVYLGLHLTFSRYVLFFSKIFCPGKIEVMWCLFRPLMSWSRPSADTSIANGQIYSTVHEQWIPCIRGARDLMCVRSVGDLCEQGKSNSLWTYCVCINQGHIPDTLLSLHFILSGKTWTEIW